VRERREKDKTDNLILRSSRNRPQNAPTDTPSRFGGSGNTLGSESQAGEVIPDPTSSAPRPVTRILTFWRDGFSIEDGPLMRYDDPANQEILKAIQSGRAPLSIMNVEPGQPTEVNIFKRMEEDYVPPKKAKVAFGGQGNRLGSPTVGTESSAAAAPPSSSIPTTASSGATAAPPATVSIDDAQPTVNMQIRLGDGTRLVSRFNTTHTVGDIYAFVRASSPASAARNWTLLTTFPNKTLSDHGAIIGDTSELRRGAVIVQKWE
jgi:UBX domain-containing protein 1